MFRKDYTASLLDSKWNVVKNRVKFKVIPRSGEYVFFDGLYHEVINIVHTLDGKHGIFIIINETPHQINHSKTAT